MSYKAGFIGLVGLPNAGKSRLVNELVGEKVGIVTAKPQTTRQSVVGIYTDDEAQLIFSDAPGRIKASKGLNHFLEKELDSVIENADVLLAVLSVDTEKKEEIEQVLDLVSKAGKPWAVVITKTDLKERRRVPIIRSLITDPQVPVIAGNVVDDKEELIKELVSTLKTFLPDSQGPLFDKELYTTQSMRDVASEVIRESCFECLHQEIPYSLATKVQKFEENDGPTVKIYADVILGKGNHKAIVIGEKAQMIKRIGQHARKEIESILGRKVYLDLNVKVKENWTKNDHWMKEFGYVTP